MEKLIEDKTGYKYSGAYTKSGALVNTASGLLLIPSVPFALAPFTQKYLDNIQDYRYINKKNENRKEEAINNAKDNR
ncbi:hypothetical protein H0A43_09890 [Arcobacter lanthieri]|uniref:hypothetical protein n=1 Tax=Aliarcobacter lanthieri TaxID=1355374 RepID=UPI0019235A07|nr:hypothetical protein [Aliarcobacter lanthieri]MBL3520785.1 hypothetical protein [Aliarcobacter lanthieri]